MTQHGVLNHVQDQADALTAEIKALAHERNCLPVVTAAALTFTLRGLVMHSVKPGDDWREVLRGLVNDSIEEMEG